MWRQQQAAQAEAPCRNRNRQYAANAVDGSVQRQFAQHDGVIDGAAVQLPGRGEQAQGDWKVKGGPRLANVGGRQIHGYAMRRKGEPGIPDRGTDAIPALPDGRIRETHHCEVGESERHVHLDVNRVRIDAKHGRAPKACEHGPASCKDPGRRSRYERWTISERRPRMWQKLPHRRQPRVFVTAIFA